MTTDDFEHDVRTAIRDLVPDPAHSPGFAARVHHLARQQRRRRRLIGGTSVLAAAALAAAAIVGGWIPGVRMSAAVPATPRVRDLDARSWCPPGAESHTAPLHLTGDFHPVMVVSCNSALALREGQGLWVRDIERHVVEGIDSYLTELRQPGPMIACLPGLTRVDTVPILLVDAAGHTLVARPPSFCDSPVQSVVTAAKALTWQTSTLRWVRQVLPPAATTAACLPTWTVPTATTNTDLTFIGATEGPATITVVAPGKRLICGRLSQGATSNMTDRLVQAEATPGAQVHLAALNQAPRLRTASDPSRCQPTPARRAYAVTVDGQLIGYAALGCRVSVIATHDSPAGALLTQVAALMGRSTNELPDTNGHIPADTP